MENLQEIIKRINNRKDLAKYSDIKSKIIYGSMIDTADVIKEFMHDAFILDPDLKNNFDNGYLEIINMCWKVFDKICTKLKDDDKTNDFEIVKDINDGAKEIKEVIDNFKKGNDKDGTN